MKRSGTRTVLALACTAAAAWYGLRAAPVTLPERPEAVPAPVELPAGNGPDTEALEVIKGLAVSGDRHGGYDRDLFGQAWSDDVDVDGGHDGCDTRNQILARDLTDVEVRPGTNGCVVVAGELTDPYTGRRLRFTKADAGAVQVDHIVSLSSSWQKGAWAWGPDRRRDFANDPLNLVAVDGPTNQAKSDSTPAEWMPPNPAAACWYADRYAQVSAKYSLPVTAADQAAMAAACK